MYVCYVRAEGRRCWSMLVDADTVPGRGTDGLAAGWRPQRPQEDRTPSESQAPAGSLPTSEQSPPPSKAATPDTRHPPHAVTLQRPRTSTVARAQGPAGIGDGQDTSGGRWGACWVLGTGCWDAGCDAVRIGGKLILQSMLILYCTCSGSECGTPLPLLLASARGSRDGAAAL
jgi:hypothetical protein